MSLSFEDDAARLLSALNQDEQEHAVAYLTEVIVEGDARLSLPGVELRIRTASRLGFIDQDPTANWGHPARYVLLPSDGVGHLISTPARYPPFARPDALKWRVVYRASGLPETAVHPC